MSHEWAVSNYGHIAYPTFQASSAFASLAKTKSKNTLYYDFNLKWTTVLTTNIQKDSTPQFWYNGHRNLNCACQIRAADWVGGWSYKPLCVLPVVQECISTERVKYIQVAIYVRATITCYSYSGNCHTFYLPSVVSIETYMYGTGSVGNSTVGPISKSILLSILAVLGMWTAC